MRCAFKVKLNSRMTFLFRMVGRLLLKLGVQYRLGKWRGTEREKNTREVITTWPYWVYINDLLKPAAEL